MAYGLRLDISSRLTVQGQLAVPGCQFSVAGERNLDSRLRGNDKRRIGANRCIAALSSQRHDLWLLRPPPSVPIVCPPSSVLSSPWFTGSFHSYYNPTERRFPCSIFGSAQHKSWTLTDLCLAPRRQGRQGEQHCHLVFLAIFASLRENRFWLRPKAALGDSCHSWWKSIWFRSKAGLRKSVPSAASWSCGLPSRGRLGYIFVRVVRVVRG